MQSDEYESIGSVLLMQNKLSYFDLFSLLFVLFCFVVYFIRNNKQQWQYIYLYKAFTYMLHRFYFHVFLQILDLNTFQSKQFSTLLIAKQSNDVFVLFFKKFFFVCPNEWREMRTHTKKGGTKHFIVVILECVHSIRCVDLERCLKLTS